MGGDIKSDWKDIKKGKDLLKRNISIKKKPNMKKYVRGIKKRKKGSINIVYFSFGRFVYII